MHENPEGGHAPLPRCRRPWTDDTVFESDTYIYKQLSADIIHGFEKLAHFYQCFMEFRLPADTKMPIINLNLITLSDSNFC